MKKIITLIVSVAVLISASLIQSGGVDAVSMRGEKIKTAEEFFELIESVESIFNNIDKTIKENSVDNTNADNSVGKIQMISAITQSPDITTALEDMQDKIFDSDISYKSMSIKKELSYYTLQSGGIGVDGKTYYYERVFDGVYHMYLTEDAAMLEVDGYEHEYFGDKESDNDDGATTTDINFRYYIDKDDIYSMINKFHSPEMNDKEKEELSLILGKWVDVDGNDAVSDLIKRIYLSGERSNFKYYSDFFKENSEDIFEKAGNIYTMKEQYYEEFLLNEPAQYAGNYGNIKILDYADLDDMSGCFYVNLDNKKKPSLTHNQSAKYIEDDLNAFWDIKSNLTFANIGHTVIEKPEDVLTEEELKGIFGWEDIDE